jgi:hypothetical protein
MTGGPSGAGEPPACIRESGSLSTMPSQVSVHQETEDHSEGVGVEQGLAEPSDPSSGPGSRRGQVPVTGAWAGPFGLAAPASCWGEQGQTWRWKTD